MGGVKKFRTIALLTAAIMILGSISAFAATDLQGHWSEQVLSQWIDEGWLSGYDQGIYRPDGMITRAEFVVLVNRILNMEDTVEDGMSFSDVSEDQWYHSDVMKAVAAGYVKGTPEGMFNPESNITRQEAIVILGRIAEDMGAHEAAHIVQQIADSDDISEWALSDIINAVMNGYIIGDKGAIRPLGYITRAESVTLLNRFKKNERALYFSGEYKLGDAARVEILGEGITLSDTIVDGDLIISEIVGKGKTTLRDVIVNGIIDDRSAGSVEEETEEPVVDSKYADGVYLGHGYSYEGLMKVEVTIEDGVISKAEIISSGDTRAYLKAVQVLQFAVVLENSTDVDTISGATKSSKGFLAAVDDALSQAEGLTASPGKSDATYQTLLARESTRRPSLADQGTVAEGSYSDGTFQGSAEGYRSTVVVQVTVSGGKITSIDVIEQNETNAYWRRTANLPGEIITAQTTNGIDTVSSATYSSIAILNATTEALNKSVAGQGSVESPGIIGGDKISIPATTGEALDIVLDLEPIGGSFPGTETVKLFNAAQEEVDSANYSYNNSSKTLTLNDVMQKYSPGQYKLAIDIASPAKTYEVRFDLGIGYDEEVKVVLRQGVYKLVIGDNSMREAYIRAHIDYYVDSPDPYVDKTHTASPDALAKIRARLFIPETGELDFGALQRRGGGRGSQLEAVFPQAGGEYTVTINAYGPSLTFTVTAPETIVWDRTGYETLPIVIPDGDPTVPEDVLVPGAEQ